MLATLQMLLRLVRIKFSTNRLDEGMKMTRIVALLAAASISCPTPALASEASLKAEIAALKAQLAAQAEQLARLEAATQALSHSQAETSAKVAAIPAALPLEAAPAPVELAATTPATTIGGYGEISYNNYLKDSSRNEADLKRFVLFFGHRFNDRLSFNSEVEIEHAIASADDPGEVEVEQAYLSYAFDPAINVKAGLFLMPFGFINRSHEPPTFFGVERNEVETRIIPSTYREGGIGIYGTTSFGLSYDAGITTGFNVAKFDDAGNPLGGSHQELVLAKASNLSVYGSLEYRPAPGLLVGGAIFAGNATQKNADFKADASLPDFSGIQSRVTLWDVHARWQPGRFDFQGLYARGSISNAAALNGVITAYNTANSANRPLLPSAFYGWLAQGAYVLPLGNDVMLAPFVRYEKFNTQSRLSAGVVPDAANRDRVLTTGLSFKPIPDVVLKADYQKFFTNSENDRLNFGIGYQF